MSGIFSRPLYHGTIDRIERIELERGRRNKDFGQGFYLAFDVHHSKDDRREAPDGDRP